MTMGKTQHRVRWQYGAYTTVFTVWADDDDAAIAKAKAQATREKLRGLPMAYESWQVLDAENAP